MGFNVDVRVKGKCKHCGKWFYVNNRFWYMSFEKHLAFEHNLYYTKYWKFRAKLRNLIKGWIK